MTSEVVVMNRMGVALAADSAVTSEVDDSSKVRDSAVKLFMLSKYHPVGVMVYNNSLLLGVPWETLIKLFRSELGTRSLPTLAEYGEALIDYLDENMSLFPPDLQDRYFMQVLNTEFGQINKKALEILFDAGLYMGRPQISEYEFDDADLIESSIELALEDWRSKEAASYFDGVCVEDLVNRNSGGINQVVQNVFAEWSLNKACVDNLNEIAKHVVSKDHFIPELFSGLIIAGFGEAEHFPVVQHLKIGGIYGNKLKVRQDEAEEVSEDNPARIIAFGYSEMVNTFLYGVSERIRECLEDAKMFIRKMPELALNVVPGLSADQKSKALKVVRQASVMMATDFGYKVYGECSASVEEIESAVELLAVKDLAQVASTLVGLGSFQKQMSLDQEIVGGPVDVAVISKGDGFIWIDRKHYFDRAFNSHFFQNYYNDGLQMQENDKNEDVKDKQDDK